MRTLRRGWRTDRPYRRIRAGVLHREPLCRSCAEQGLTRAATEVDHIRPVALGGEPYCVENLQPLCRTCHLAKSAQEFPPARGKLERGPEWNQLIAEQADDCH